MGELAGVSDSMIEIRALLKEFDIPGLIENVTTLEGLVSHMRALERNKNVQGTGDNAAGLEERVSSIDQAQAQLEGAVHTMRGEFLDDMTIMKDELGELNTKVNITMRAVGNDNHNLYAEGVGQRQMKVPEPRAFGRARDVKELENFLFDMEQYFRAVKMDSEEAKNVECIARRNLRELKQTGTIREYMKKFAGLMLDIRDMSEKDKMFYFLEGLKPWARAELQRQWVQDLAIAQATAERLKNYAPESFAKCPQKTALNALQASVRKAPQSHADEDEDEDESDEDQPRMGALRFIGALMKHAESSKKSGDKGLMFVKGHLGRKPATSVMLDTGATHNFVSETEAKKLGLKLEKDSDRMKAVNSKSLPIAGQANSLLIMGKQPAMMPAVIKQLGEIKHMSALQFKKAVKRHEPTFVAVPLLLRIKGMESQCRQPYREF
ncbi:Gag-asp_proteas domain-containing protein [Quillaja saponaria]|uniref:Gag-asp_proteas domain-containing protein n=1 Tax=Quillaja saponaria TaxID=32244 RepID=A0AAD7VKI3_QUISA|nr:Gag-asp_proteas domain-containing protein [Quillaja saponaria]